MPDFLSVGSVFTSLSLGVLSALPNPDSSDKVFFHSFSDFCYKKHYQLFERNILQSPATSPKISLMTQFGHFRYFPGTRNNSDRWF